MHNDAALWVLPLARYADDRYGGPEPLPVPRAGKSSLRTRRLFCWRHSVRTKTRTFLPRQARDKQGKALKKEDVLSQMLMYAILGAPIIIAAGANEQNTAVRPVVVLKILSRFLVSRFLVFSFSFRKDDVLSRQARDDHARNVQRAHNISTLPN